jgi:DNA-binding transcriptional LysR family regulator
MEGPLSCNDGAVLHDWALGGLGLSWRSLWEVGEDLSARRLVSVLDEFAAPPTRVYCVQCWKCATRNAGNPPLGMLEGGHSKCIAPPPAN